MPPPHVDVGHIDAPHVDVHMDAPRPHVDVPPPHIDAPRPHVDVPPPHGDAPRPHLDVPVPHVDAPVHVDVPAAHVDVPRPHVDLPPQHLDVLPAPAEVTDVIATLVKGVAAVGQQLADLGARVVRMETVQIVAQLGGLQSSVNALLKLCSSLSDDLARYRDEARAEAERQAARADVMTAQLEKISESASDAIATVRETLHAQIQRKRKRL